MSTAPSIIIPTEHQAAPSYTKLRGDDANITSWDSEYTRLAKTESWIARNILAALDKQYPGREWRLSVDALNGIIMLQAPLLDAEKGYFMHMERKTIHELQEQAVKAAGEVIERFGLSHNKRWDPESIEDLARNVRGNAKTSDSDAESITGSKKTLKEGEK